MKNKLRLAATGLTTLAIVLACAAWPVLAAEEAAALIPPTPPSAYSSAG